MAKIIAISGTLGSGKSTVSKLLAQKLGFEYYGTGVAFRELAKARGVTPLELNEISKTDPSIDAEIDSAFAKLVETDKNYVVDSRLAFHFIPSAFKVELLASAAVAGKRIFGDSTRTEEKEYATVQDSIASLLHRRALEVERYYKTYGVDVTALGNFDLVIDTDLLSPEQVCERIIEAFKAKG